MSSSGMGRDIHSLVLSIQHFLGRPRGRPSSKVPRRMLLEKVLLRVTCSNQAGFHLLTVAREGSCGPTKELILLHTQSLVMCSNYRSCGEVSSGTWLRRLGSFSQSQQAGSMFHSHREQTHSKKESLNQKLQDHQDRES